MAWGLKKNTKKSEREAILAKVNSGVVIDKARVGTVAVNRVKLKRWRAGYNNGPRGVKKEGNSQYYLALIRDSDIVPSSFLRLFVSQRQITNDHHISPTHPTFNILPTRRTLLQHPHLY